MRIFSILIWLGLIIIVSGGVDSTSNDHSKPFKDDLEGSDREGVRVVSILEQTASTTVDSIKTITDEEHQLPSEEEPPAPDVSHLSIVAKPDSAHALEAEEAGDDPKVAPAEVEVDGVSKDPQQETAKEVEEEAEKVEADKVEGDVAELGPDSAAEGDKCVGAEVEAGVNEEEAEAVEGASAEHADVEEAAEEEEADRNDSSTEIESDEKAAGKQTTDTESVDYAGDEAVSPTVEMGTEADATATATEDSDGNVSVTPASNNALAGKEPLAVVKCFACTSLNDANCTTKAEVQVNCKPLQGTTENGCYTLVKVDLNTTTRGCISDLAEVGMKYCQDNGRFCMLCYADGCNNRQATASSHANPLSQHVALAVFLLAVTGAYYF